MVIWANHNLRSSVKAMQDTTKKIFKNEHLLDLDIAPVKEIFRL